MSRRRPTRRTTSTYRLQLVLSMRFSMVRLSRSLCDGDRLTGGWRERKAEKAAGERERICSLHSQLCSAHVRYPVIALLGECEQQLVLELSWFRSLRRRRDAPSAPYATPMKLIQQRCLSLTLLWAVGTIAVATPVACGLSMFRYRMTFALLTGLSAGGDDWGRLAAPSCGFSGGIRVHSARRKRLQL